MLISTMSVSLFVVAWILLSALAAVLFAIGARRYKARQHEELFQIPERRRGRDRRTGGDRRRVSIDVGIERRRGADRRTGLDRRSSWVPQPGD
jgi:hypothetical protein